MAQLRGILFDQSVTYPSNAKKKELLQIFEKNVRGNSKKAKKMSKPRELVIFDAPQSKVLVTTESESEEVLATPAKTGNSNEVSSATKSNSRKRKPLHRNSDIKYSDSPTKGNVFGVDSDSEPDILSPRKKTKGSRTSTPQRLIVDAKEASESVNTPVSANIASSKTPGSKTTKSVKAIGDPTTPLSKKISKAIETAEPATFEKTTRSIKDARVQPTISSPAPSKMIEIPKAVKSPKSESPAESATSTPKTKSPQVKESKTSLIDPLVKSELPDVSSTGSNWQNSFQTVSGISDHSVDNAQSFDLALKKLKKEDEHFNEAVKLTKDVRDVELAKLLGVDIQSVKPKVRGKRIVSPRYPIIIQKKRLAYNEDLSEEESDTETEGKENDDEDEQDSDEAESVDEKDSEDSEKSEELPELVVKNTKNQKPQIHISNSKIGKSLLWGGIYLLTWSLFASITLFAYWYREQTFLVGYCGQEIYQTTIPNTPDTPDFLVKAGAYLDLNFRPQCVECPQHARCFPNLEIGCYDDFVEFAPWYFPYMPVVDPHLKKCVPDTKRAEKIEIMIDVALDLLRARNANRNCGRLPEDDLDAGIEIKDLHDLILAMKAPYITLEEFEELWERSVVELEKEPEIIVRQVTI